MKNVFLRLFCGLFSVFFIVNCATMDELMVRNSRGYDVNSLRDDNRDLLSRPEWVKNFEAWSAVQAKSNDNLHYFMGKSTPDLRELEKKGMNYWSRSTANQEALADAMKQVTNFIGMEIKTDYSERVSEVQKQKGAENNGVTVADLKQYEAEEENLLQFFSSSSAYFGGLQPREQFDELWEKQTKQGKIHAYYYWIVYSISQDDIDKARQEIAAERQEARDEKTRRESLEKDDENYFVVLSGQYENAMEELKSIDFSEDEKQFGGKYNELLGIHARIQALSLMKNRDDEIGRRYKALLENFGKELQENDPGNRQLRIIDNLRRQTEGLQLQLVEKDARIDELRSRKLEYNLQTQTLIVAYPQRPNETVIEAVNIFAANDMVSNRDYISFAHINGINSLARGDLGLGSPAVLITWNDAARYCNWLSRLYGYTPYYTELKGQITGFDRTRNGYRLPDRNELMAILTAQPGIIDEAEFTQTAVWGAEGTASGHQCYKLSAGTGAPAGRLSEQSIVDGLFDLEIGFRVVRNAK